MADTKKVIIEVEVNQGADLEVLKKQLDEIGVRLKKTKLASDDASKSMSAGFKAGADAASIIPGPIGQAATAMNGLTSGVGKFVSALGTVKGALIATGVGAFVVIIGTLITYFTETEKGAQKLRVVMAGLGAVVRTVADAIMTLNFSDLTSKIKDNTNAAIANANALNKVEEAEGDLTVKRAEANKEIAKARLIADDLTKSERARADAYKQRVLDNHIRAAAAKAGLHVDAIDDALLRAQSIFTLDENGNAVQLDSEGQAVLGKDGKTPFSPTEWLENPPKHWLMSQASGGGANGGRHSNDGGSKTMTRAHFNSLEADKRGQAIKTHTITD